MAKNEAKTETEGTAKVETKAVKKAPRIVTMEDGTQVNFGHRSNLVSTMDLPTATLTFKISTGTIRNWIVENMVVGLTDLQRKVFMYGLLERVKSSLAPIKVPDLEEAINKQIAAIDKGEFNIRSTGDFGSTGLTMIMKAFAQAKASLSPDHKHWENLEDGVVISEVFTEWSSKDAKGKNEARKNPHVKYFLSILEREELDPEATSDL